MTITAQFWITTLAIVLSPVVAVLVSMSVQAFRERRQEQIKIFHTLVATRNQITSAEHVRALNLIDVVFPKASTVRTRWHELFEMLNNEGMNNPIGQAQWGKKRVELITAMANELGYGKFVTHLDIDRIYHPAGLNVVYQLPFELQQELLRVLKTVQLPVPTPPNK